MAEFGTDGIRGKGEALLRAGVAEALARAIGAEKPQRVVLGGDVRNTTAELLERLTSELARFDVDVYVAGIVPTPALSFAVEALHADFGVMVTASHNPPEDNGLKVLVRGGMKPDEYMERKLAERMETAPRGKSFGRLFALDTLQEMYADKLYGIFGRTLTGARVRMDCCHGATARFAPEVYEALGVTVEVEKGVRCGARVNVGCGSTHPEYIKRKTQPQELGVAFDGDGDRAICVKDGSIIDGDGILYYVSDMLKRENPQQKDLVVGTVLTNTALERELARRGARLLRTDVGDKHVLRALLREGGVLGGEPSGHILSLKHAAGGDGMLAALLLLRALKDSKLPAYLPLPVFERSFAVDCKRTALADPNIQALCVEAENTPGFDGRILVRASGTEEKVRVLVEGTGIDAEDFFAKLDLFFANFAKNVKS